MYIVGEKLEAVKTILKKWNREVFGKVDARVENLRKQMFQIQDARRISPGDDHLAKLEKEVTHDYISTLKLEESMLKQKSRVQWLELGDGNNKFFHRSLMVRRNKNQIR